MLCLSRAWTPAPRKHDGSFEAAREREDVLLSDVSDVCRRYGVSRVAIDQYCAPAVADRLTRAGLYVVTLPVSAQSKSQMFGEVRARLSSRTLELYEQRDLLAELRRLRTKYTAGASTVLTPRVGGSHCDLAMGLALAAWEFDRHGLGGGDAGAFFRRMRERSEPAFSVDALTRVF